MKYIEPNYELTVLSTNDVIAASSMGETGSEASLEEVNEFKASISASLKDIL